jgi:cytosine/adenosine deaminase-related metal-dependent hydrolase
MKFFPLVLALLLSVGASAGPRSNEPDPSRIWITDVTIVSPENLADLARGSVVIENERIVRVERKASAKPPAGATVVSGEGGFLIPGLIDSHVHLASIPGVTLELTVNPDAAHAAMLADYYKQLPRSYLYFGYTTLIL